ncbi:D-2-hydroxyacid dehydrogenase family protein [Blastococcus brunescens]|uniref:D-2-hydroxyacid dehydrogenase family protein n=1 Tax=Blastococcus brunescens TaxID=1564165 RepID=A0ABZ1B302_9ACTN|nr:D-2-hydroxyacid dehydrogenase family protein [Blastococcus sp. BMG 8361]WRL64233.1 D-2-hydroxyacid dehydrogenase family protein [Blastococcus sp. BMG 8361]
MVRALEGFDVVVAMRERTPLPATVLEQLPQLRLLVTTGMQNASIDMTAAAGRGITVCGTQSDASGPAELTWGLILALARHLVPEDAATRSGRWQQTVGTGLRGRTLGLIGLGRIGGLVGHVGLAFGMRVLAWSQHLTAERAAEVGAELVGKDRLLAESDVVSLHLRLSDRTRAIVGAAELSAMRPGAVLVNTSRAGLVDQAALIDALSSGGIAGAGLDVYEEEPVGTGAAILAAPNTVLTPHLGYVTDATYDVFFGQAVEDVAGFLAGSPVRVLAAPEPPR